MNNGKPNQFKAGDKVKIVKATLSSYWYADRIGDVFTLSSQIGNGDWRVVEDRDGCLSTRDIELVEDEKESISKFLCENKWFIRTGSPDKSKLVQEWLFEHGCEWLYGKNVQSGFNEELLTNTNCMGVHEKYILFSTTYEKTNAQEITLNFETIVKSVKLPELAQKTEAQLKLEELQRTIEAAQRQIEQLKEEI